ncbi:MAG TPA: hypothetical protein VK886_23710 [Vicinamibacterales bacterium]|nr:hypothetical protein [Vicinamibacterales bacterium]
MKVTTRVASAALVALMFSAVAAAHEGHDHKIMGTVTAVQSNRLEVKAVKDGTLSAVAVNEKTKIVRDKAILTMSDVKVGDRVVVTASQAKDSAGKPVLVAKEIRLGH